MVICGRLRRVPTVKAVFLLRKAFISMVVSEYGLVRIERLLGV